MKQKKIFTTEETMAALGHFAWCAVVALRLAQLDGQPQSPLMAHAFLMRWLETAQRQKRFSRAIANELEELMRSGRQKGAGPAKLPKRFSEAAQSELYRLTFAIDQLKSQGWINAVVTDKEWQSDSLRDEFAGERALLVRKSELMRHFSQVCRLLARVTFMVTGKSDPMCVSLSSFCLLYEVSEPGVIILKPSSDFI